MISYIMNTKNCMSVLLLSDRFDSFSFIGGEITTYCTFQIDGTYHPEFFADKEDAGSEPYVRWSYVREYCLSLIKGKQTPCVSTLSCPFHRIRSKHSCKEQISLTGPAISKVFTSTSALMAPVCSAPPEPLFTHLYRIRVWSICGMAQ